MRSVLFAAAASALLIGPAYGAAFGYDLCGFTKQIRDSRARDFAKLRGDMLQPGTVYDMKDGGAEYALTVNPGEGAECGLLARGSDSFGEQVPARIYCTLGPARDFAESQTLYNAAIGELKACLPRAGFTQSQFGDLTKPGDPVRWSTEIEDTVFSLVVSMSALPQIGRAPGDGQFTVRYQLWNMPGSVPAKKPAARKK